MKKIIIVFLFLLGCSHTSTEHLTLSETYNTKRIKELAKEFIQDIGGEEVIVSTSIKGFYFNPKLFQKNEILAYKKWRPLFAKPKNCKLAEIFQIDFQGTTLLSLFSLPKTPTVKKDCLSLLCLPPFSLPVEFDPKWILTYLSKGVHVLAINYEKQEKTNSSKWQKTCEDAICAASWLKAKTSCKLMVLGKSFGAIPASYVAATLTNTSLILENPILLPSAKSKKWLNDVTGKILTIQTFNAKPLSYLPPHATVMTVMGGYFSSYFGEKYPTWYENEKDQLKLLKFLAE